MAKFSRRSEHKRSQRRDRVRRQRDDRRRRHAYLAAYPRLSVEANGAPRELVGMIEEAVAGLKFDGPQFGAAERDLLRSVNRGDFAGGRAEEVPLVGPARQPPVVNLVNKVGLLLYALMPQARLSELLIDNDVRVLVRGDRLVARCSGLRRREGPAGTVYYSPHRPTLDTPGGGRRVVGFTRDALRRAYDLLVPFWRTYVGHGDAFETVCDCTYYEPCRLADGRAALTFYQECRPGYWGRDYARAVLGPEAAGLLRPLSLRLGYCPVEDDGEFAVATTFLCPGHEGTPEHALLAASPPGPGRDELEAAARRTSTAYLRSTGDFSAVRWFHEHGIPQVLPIDRPLYRPHDAGAAVGGGAV